MKPEEIDLVDIPITPDVDRPHEFCDECPGCRPALSVQGGDGVFRPMPKDTPEMRAIDKVWDNRTTYGQRKAYIEVTLHADKHPDNIRQCKEVMAMIHDALQSLDQG